MLLVKIAFRNIFRHKRRTLLTLISMAGGYALMSISFAIIEGSYSRLIDAFTKSYVGHVQIHKQGFLDKPSVYLTIPEYDKAVETLNSSAEVKSWAPRVIFSSLAYGNQKTMGVQAVGIDPDKEKNTTRIEASVKKGKYLQPEFSKEILVGYGIAKVLKLKLGDAIVLMGQAADGSIANDEFFVRGIMGDETDTRNKHKIYMELQAAQEYLALEKRIHEVAVVIDDFRRSQSFADQLQNSLSIQKLTVSPWEEVESGFYKAMQIDKKGNNVTLFIVMFVVGVSILNTVLMNIFERTKEFGVMIAIGTRPQSLSKIIFLEVSFLSFISVLCGVGVAYAANYYFATHGILFEEGFEYGGVVFDRMIASLDFFVFAFPAVLTWLVAVLVSFIPAYRLRKLSPIEALREF